MQKSLAIVFMVCSILAQSSVAQETPYEKTIDRFFAMIAEGKAAEALDSLYASSPYANLQTTELQQLKTQLAGLSNIMGKYLDHTLYGQADIQNRYVHLEYFVAYERRPLRVSFTFYKPKDKWFVDVFSYNSDYVERLAAKIEMEKSMNDLNTALDQIESLSK